MHTANRTCASHEARKSRRDRHLLPSLRILKWKGGGLSKCLGAVTVAFGGHATCNTLIYSWVILLFKMPFDRRLHARYLCIHTYIWIDWWCISLDLSFDSLRFREVSLPFVFCAVLSMAAAVYSCIIELRGFLNWCYGVTNQVNEHGEHRRRIALRCSDRQDVWIDVRCGESFSVYLIR